jgi:hypothetical protein
MNHDSPFSFRTTYIRMFHFIRSFGQVYMATDTTNTKLRTQLLHLGERFIGFDKLVESEARNARRLDSKKSDVLSRAISELEKGVHTEIRARAEANRQFQSDIELFSNTVFEKMQNRVAKRLERLLAELDSLETRCITLERGQQQFRGEIPSKLLVDTAALVKEMNALKTRLDDDIKVWRTREEAVLRRIEGTVKNVVVEVEKFESVGDDLITKVKQDVGKLSRESAAKRDTIIGDISELRQAIQLEEENRKYADSEILFAVDSYSGVLQKGLKEMVNASDASSPKEYPVQQG